ncbi:MAG: glycosyltransferase, partial [Bacteroidetes bacterium]
MGFASTYLADRSLFHELIKEAPDKQTGIIVVVPAYDEPDITGLLDSLALCTEPECGVEVIVVVNAPSNASVESIENNKVTIENIESWKKSKTDCFFRLFAFITDQQSISNWGVGLARKTGMDEAVRRFNSIDNPEGIILNLDADCQVEKNYFISVFSEFKKKPDRAACSICFEHPLSGNDFPPNVYKYITLYELHLRYYFQGLGYCGFPYVFHTVGSAIAVKALTYIKAGGMNRRQAGEDFYFIQKLVPSGGYFNLNSTTVYPSPRVSIRVPFGTGASIGKLTEENPSTLLTYNILAFKELRIFFEMAEKVYQCESEELQKCYFLFPEGLRLFLDEKEWTGKMMELKN